MDSFEEQVFKTVRRHRLLEGGETVVVALSGGPDSVALLLALEGISPLLDLEIHAAHANHQLRGDESEHDALFVENLCDRLQVPLASRKLEVNKTDASQNLEDRVRKLRYDFLAEVAHSKAGVLATGHNRDDQAETFLMKLFRGAGPSGLSGIYIKRHHRLATASVSVIRPLLEVSRSEITAYLGERGQPFREDSTNTLLDYDRNWIRHRLLPTLVGRFNSGISRTLARNASLFTEINSYLEKQGHKHLGEVGAQADMDFLIDISRFRDAPLALRKQMAREAIRRVKGDLLDISHSHIQAMLAMVGGTSGKQLHLPGNIRIVREFDHLRIGKGSAEITKFEYELQPPGYLRVTELEKAVCIRKVKTVDAGRGDLLSTRFKRIVVRNRRPGDRYLISTEKEKTLKRLFLENRVPISRRDRLVLLESEENLIWIEGFPVNPTARAGDSDSEGFEIEVTDETFGPGKPSK